MHCLNFWSAWTHLIQVHWLTANSACTEIRLIQPFSSNSRVIQCLLHSLLAMNHPECFCYSVQIGNRSAMFLSFNSKRSNSSCRRARKRLLLTLCIRGIRFTFTHDHRTRLKGTTEAFTKFVLIDSGPELSVPSLKILSVSVTVVSPYVNAPKNSTPIREVSAYKFSSEGTVAPPHVLNITDYAVRIDKLS